MIKIVSLKPRTGKFSPWLAALVGIVVIKAVLSLSAGSLPLAYQFSGISYLILLLVAAGFSIRNSIHRTLRVRPFWLLLAAGYGLWSFHQFMDVYYDLVLKTPQPDNTISDDFLFLHLVPFMAAVATLPNLRIPDGRQHRWILNTVLLFGFWTFLYGFIVAPYKYVPFSFTNYGVRFDDLYLVENCVLILILGVAALRATGPWKMIYLHMLGAEALYTLSSAMANLAIEAGGYVAGKLYGLGLIASACWFVWIPLSAQAVPIGETSTTKYADKQDSKVSGWTMLAVVLISIPMVWELFQRNENTSIRTLRLVVATGAIILLAGGAYLKEYLDKREAALERKRAEIALRASEERFRLAAQAGKMYAVEWDAATNAVNRSGDLQSVLGLTAEELGLTLQQFLMRVHPDDRALVAAFFTNRSPELPAIQIRYRLLGPDDSIIWVERTDHAFFNAQGKIVRAVGMVTNITERMQAEDALRESEEKFRNVFRNAGVGMIIVSPDGRYLAANSTFCGYLGYSEEELLTRTVQSLTVAEDWPAFSEKMNKVLLDGGSFQREEKRCLHKSGRVVYTESSTSLIRNSEGVPKFFVAEVLDVTARRESEEALANFNRKLIQAQEQERTRIARELHDDIGQRVTALRLRMEQMRASRDRLPDDLLSIFNKIQKETAELSTSVGDLSHELHSPTLDILGLNAGIRSWCGEFSENRKIEISFESQDVPTGLSSAISLNLFRVFQEALNNAAKYSGAEHINVRLWGTPDEIQLTVSDAGKGFDVDTATKGGGLGLRSMRERVKLMNGHLTIESKPNRGTMIHARVPFDSGSQKSPDTNSV